MKDFLIFLTGFVLGFATALALIIGIVVLPVILGLFLVILLIAYFKYRKEQKRREEILKDFWKEE